MGDLEGHVDFLSDSGKAICSVNHEVVLLTLGTRTLGWEPQNENRNGRNGGNARQSKVHEQGAEPGQPVLLSFLRVGLCVLRVLCGLLGQPAIKLITTTPPHQLLASYSFGHWIS